MPPTLLPVKVQPRARRNAIEGFLGGQIRLRVTAPAERGRANEAAMALVAERLGIAKSQITLARGASSRYKLVRIEGLDEREVRRRLQVGGDG